MNTLNFLDSNVWLALFWGRHIHAEKAREWFESHGSEQFLFCRFTQLTLLSLLTTEQIMGTDVKTMADAWALWDLVWADSRIAFLSEPDGLDGNFRKRSQLPGGSPKVWADGYLLAFASAAGLKFITFDRALRSQGVDVLVL